MQTKPYISLANYFPFFFLTKVSRENPDYSKISNILFFSGGIVKEIKVFSGVFLLMIFFVVVVGVYLNLV